MNVEKNLPNPPKDSAQAQTAQRAATAPLLVSFIAGDAGPWHIDRITPVAGESLAMASRLDVIEGTSTAPREARLRGRCSADRR